MDIMLALTQLQPPPPPAMGPGSLQPPLPSDLQLPSDLTPLLPPVDSPLAARFSALMAHDRVSVTPVSSVDAGAMVSDLLHSEDMAMQYVSNDMLFMLEHANGMTMRQFSASAMQVQIEAGSLQVDMQVKMSVVTSSKDAIETLMKNQ
jgi:type III secretion inner rod protein HrpB2